MNNHRPLLNRINQFIDANRDRMIGVANNTFALAFGQVSRYYSILEIVQGRYDQVSATFTKYTLAHLAGSAAFDHTESYDLSLRLHLEIESFYIFTKLLLDRTADAIAHFFGFKWRGIGSTHSKLSTQYEDERRRYKDLPPLPEDLQQRIAQLKKHIINHRNEFIEHVQDARMVHATSFSREGRTRIVPTVIYPSSAEQVQYAETLTPKEIFVQLDTYLAALFEFLSAHIENSPLTRVTLPDATVT